MTNDVMRMSALGLTVFPVAEFAAVIFIAVSLLLIYWPLGLIVLFGSPVAIWLMGRLSNNFARSSRSYQDLLATTVAKATDLVAGYRVIKGIRAEDEATRRYRDASRTTLRGAFRNLGFLGRYLAGSSVVSSLFVVGITMLAGYYALQGHMSVGELIAAVGLTQVLLPQMGMLVNNAIPALAAARASAQRVVEHIREADLKDLKDPEELEDTATGSTAAELPEVPRLDITVAGAEVNVNPGEMIGIVASDRMAADLVAALLRPDTERTASTGIAVSVDEHAADGLDYADYRSRVLVSPHNVALSSGTIADNLAEVATPELREQVIHAASCEDFADAAGAADSTGEMGARLSGGQRQRLALARALGTDAPVLVLHDPTTAVDSVTEQAIATRIAGVRAGCTTVLVASSSALLAAGDRGIDVREGAAS